MKRRAVLAGLAAAPFAPSLLRAQTGRHVVILGAGFGGGSLARALRRADAGIRVTLIERGTTIHTCPFSNGVLGGMWPLERVGFSTDGLTAAGIDVIHAEAIAIEPENKAVILADGTRIAGDALVLAPGISFDWTAIEGLTEETAESMPHAWQGSPDADPARSTCCDGGWRAGCHGYSRATLPLPSRPL